MNLTLNLPEIEGEGTWEIVQHTLHTDGSTTFRVRPVRFTPPAEAPYTNAGASGSYAPPADDDSATLSRSAPSGALALEDEPTAGDIYPNIDDLKSIVPAGISADLWKRLEARYWPAAKEYIDTSFPIRHDGRLENACLYKNSWAEAEEEVVDAIFNILVHGLKTKGFSPEARRALQEALRLWKTLTYD